MAPAPPDGAAACPCGSGAVFGACCEPLLDGAARAGSALALLRSRYTAYALGRGGYLDATWHPSARSAHDADSPDPAIEWRGLEVVRVENGEDEARIEFVARFTIDGRAGELRETSRFARDEGRWYYVDGTRPGPARRAAPRTGRNDPCPCGSGRKFKKCCGA